MFEFFCEVFVTLFGNIFYEIFFETFFFLKLFLKYFEYFFGNFFGTFFWFFFWHISLIFILNILFKARITVFFSNFEIFNFWKKNKIFSKKSSKYFWLDHKLVVTSWLTRKPLFNLIVVFTKKNFSFSPFCFLFLFFLEYKPNFQRCVIF